MKKKTKLILSTFAVLFVAMTIIGTVAYFSKSFTSDNNTATAANFDVDVVNQDGNTIGDGEFNLGDALFPGMDITEVYRFQVKKVKADVPVEYTVNFTTSGDLFPANTDSPVEFTMQRNVDRKWVEVDHTSAFDLINDTDNFRILVGWPHGDNDIDFQGKTGNVKLEVIVSQADQAVPNEITGNLVKTTAGEAAEETAKTIVSYKFAEGHAPQMSGFQFYINDGDGYVNDWFRGATQKIINGVVSPRTEVEVAEALVNSIYVSQKAAFLPLTEKWDVTSVGSEIIFTSKADKAYDDFEIEIRDNRAQIEGEFLNKQAGSKGQAGVNQVNTLTVGGEINQSGTLSINFDDGVENIGKMITVLKDDSHATIADKIAQEFSSLTGWDVTNSAGSENVVFISKTATADKDVKVTLTNN